MNTVRIALALSAAAMFAAPALAEEKFVELKDAPGKDAVETNCGGCHSLDYVQMNSPFMKPETWTAEVTKMIKVMGAPISDDDAKKIVDYLTANYGG